MTGDPFALHGVPTSSGVWPCRQSPSHEWSDVVVRDVDGALVFDAPSGERDETRVQLWQWGAKCSQPKRHYQRMHTNDETQPNDFERAIFSDYAFVGWVWTITHHHQEITGSTCPPEFLWLGDAGVRSWAMDAAMRKGWAMLGDDAREFATENLLPLCEPWLREMLLGIMRSREVSHG